MWTAASSEIVACYYAHARKTVYRPEQHNPALPPLHEYTSVRRGQNFRSAPHWSWMAAMEAFVAKHAAKVRGTLSCFDRVLFRGYLPLMSGWAMADFLRSKQIERLTLKPFLLEQAERMKKHAGVLASQAGRPYQYLSEPTRKEDLARKIAERDRISEGLVCVFSVVEPCRTFSLVWKEHKALVRPAKRKCLQLYYYFMDRQLGLIHVKVQTWFPFPIQVYVNGHEWLARRLDRHGLKYLKSDNVFLQVDDLARAQRLADGFASVDWVRVLGRYARRINPLLGDLLAPMQYYWVTSQSEYSTDVLFRSRADLEELMPRLLQYSTLYFEARDVMTFLGRKLNGNFQGDLVTDQLDFSKLPRRLPGRRVKHRMKRNWIKMYNKEGSALRVETVINQPDEFKIRRRVRRKGRHVIAWVPMRKGVVFLARYRQISAQTNARYLDALAHVDDPTPAVRALDSLTTRASSPNGRTVRPFNPLSRHDRMLFEALLSGEHVLHGFTNRDLRHKLGRTPILSAADAVKQSAQVTRLLRRLHAHGLIAKIPRSRRWRVSLSGRRVMAAALKLREIAYPSLYAEAA
jgi:hypothetical protein